MLENGLLQVSNKNNQMKKMFFFLVCQMTLFVQMVSSQKIVYVPQFENENHPEIGYWFITPTMINEENKIEAHVDSIAKNCKYTLLFLTAREGASFYDFPLLHSFFQKLVVEAHKKGLKVGLQLWGNYKDTSIEGSQRMIVDNEVVLDLTGHAKFIAKAKYIRFPDRLLKSDLFKVYAFKKTSDGFYDPSTLQEITPKCKSVLPNKETVEIEINGGASVKGLTACIITQEYCSQSSNWDDVEINGFVEAMKAYADIPWDGFALDEYGNKFVVRSIEAKPGDHFRARWYSEGMAREFNKSSGENLDKVLFAGRYAPTGKPELRMKAINTYMDFMRKGAVRVENAVYQKSKEIFGKDIFNGIHNTYHNSLINDEIWANGIGWWNVTRAYGQTDEKTPTAIQMGVAMAHPMNAMYNQYYDKELEPVVTKALLDLRYGIRTHYHALNDKRPLRFDLEFPEAIEKINKVENCARLLNKFNPLLPEVKLLVVFGIEALSNWYPYESDRGFYDINDKMKVEEIAVAIWKAGYLNALVPSDLIANHKITLATDGKPIMNGHKFDAIVYLNPQFAKEEEIKFLESFVAKGGKLMIEGRAEYDFAGKDISKRFQSIYAKATVKGYSLDSLSKLGIQKNLLPDGCKTEDGSFVFTNEESLHSSKLAGFEVNINGILYSGLYKGLLVISFDVKSRIKKLAAAGLTEIRKNKKVIFSFRQPTDVYVDRQSKTPQIIIADPTGKVMPVNNSLFNYLKGSRNIN